MFRAMPKVVVDHLRVIALLMMIVFVLTACSHYDDHDHPDLKTGEAWFDYHCEDCHGVDGTGKLVTQTPANILTELGRDGIVDYVTTDVNPERKMPVFYTMPYAEASAIASHLLALQQRYEALPLNRKKPPELMLEP